MPQRDGFSGFGQALGSVLFGEGSALGPRTQKERRQQELDEYTVRRNREKDALDQEKFDRQEADRQEDNRRAMESLRAQQAAQQERVRIANEVAAARQDQAARTRDITEFKAANPAVAPTAPPAPQYLPDPMVNYDTPDEVNDLGQLISGNIGGLVSTPEGAPLKPEAVPVPTLEAVRGRALEYIKIGVDPATAVAKARSDMLGDQPIYEPPTPAKPAYEPNWFTGMFYDPEPAVPARPGRINPTPGLPPAAPIDVSQSAAVRNAALREAYAKKMADFEAQRAGYRPPAYPGYPWRNPGQLPASTPAPVPAPAAVPPPAATPVQPGARSPVYRLPSGRTFTVE